MTHIDPATVTTMLGTAVSSAKNVRDLLKDWKDPKGIEVREQVAMMMDELLNIKEALLDVAEENRQLREELQRRAAVKRDAKSGYYFIEGDNDPLCPVCFEKDGKPIHLAEPGPSASAEHIYRRCKVCNNHFNEGPNPNYRAPEPPPWNY